MNRFHNYHWVKVPKTLRDDCCCEFHRLFPKVKKMKFHICTCDLQSLKVHISALNCSFWYRRCTQINNVSFENIQKTIAVRWSEAKAILCTEATIGHIERHIHRSNLYDCFIAAHTRRRSTVFFKDIRFLRWRKTKVLINTSGRRRLRSCRKRSHNL